MRFNLNEFLIAVSFALDFIEMDVLGVKSDHSKRTAYIALKLAEKMDMSSDELYDIVALAILHDNGVSEKKLHDMIIQEGSRSISQVEYVKEHCIIGERNLKDYPFLTEVKNVIKYHHEKYDGSGFFQLKGEDIPKMSQIIHFADSIESNFDLQSGKCIQQDVIDYVKTRESKDFSSRVCRAFYRASEGEKFWRDIQSKSISNIVKESIPQYNLEISIEKVHHITQVLSKIIDSKSRYTQKHSSDLAEKVSIMADYYSKNYEEKMKLIIAADLHDIGKLAVPNSILDSPNKLTNEEFEIIKKHPYYTRLALQEIRGFKEITEWAANHHEKLNGAGYPFGLKGDKLDFNSRLMACLDIYEALTENRPYRNGLTHEKAMEIMNKMVKDKLIDESITSDINRVFI